MPFPTTRPSLSMSHSWVFFNRDSLKPIDKGFFSLLLKQKNPLLRELKQVPCLRAFQRMTSFWPLLFHTLSRPWQHSAGFKFCKLLRRRRNQRFGRRGSDFSAGVCRSFLSQNTRRNPFKSTSRCVCHAEWAFYQLCVPQVDPLPRGSTWYLVDFIHRCVCVCVEYVCALRGAFFLMSSSQ